MKNKFDDALFRLERAADSANYPIDSDEDYILACQLITDAQYGNIELTSIDEAVIRSTINEIYRKL